MPKRAMKAKIDAPTWMLAAAALLLVEYKKSGPREGRMRVVPYRRFAKMTAKQIDRWDFAGRFHMQQIARLLVLYDDNLSEPTELRRPKATP